MSDLNDVPRIWVDFNNRLEDGVGLGCTGTKDDIRAKGILLSEGLPVIVYSFELEADGKVSWVEGETEWIAKIDWGGIRRLPGDSLP